MRHAAPVASMYAGLVPVRTPAVWIGVADAVRADALHDASVLSPVLRERSHVVVGAIVYGAHFPPALVWRMADDHLPRVLQDCEVYLTVVDAHNVFFSAGSGASAEVSGSIRGYAATFSTSRQLNIASTGPKEVVVRTTSNVSAWVSSTL